MERILTNASLNTQDFHYYVARSTNRCTGFYSPWYPLTIFLSNSFVELDDVALKCESRVNLKIKRDGSFKILCLDNCEAIVMACVLKKLG